MLNKEFSLFDHNETRFKNLIYWGSFLMIKIKMLALDVLFLIHDLGREFEELFKIIKKASLTPTLKSICLSDV